VTELQRKRAKREIRVTGIKFFGRHGVYPEERRYGRQFEIDVILEIDDLPGFQTDRIEDTLDYCKIAGALVEIGGGPSVMLVERLAQIMVDRCLEFSEVRTVALTLKKRASGVPGEPTWVSVHVVQHRDGS
jgi:dihydroneopterin aldolase